MVTLLELHQQHFVTREGHFSTQRTADIVADRIKRFLEGAGFAVPERYIQVVKASKTAFYIEIPRIRHVWWPKANNGEAIGHELNAIHQLVKETNQ